MKKRVSLDADGVLALFYHRLIDELNENGYGGYVLDDLTCWPFANTRIAMPMEEYYERYDDIWMNRWRLIRPSVGDVQLNMLRKKYDVDVVSNRTEMQGDMLRLWLATKYPGIDLNVVTVPRLEDKLGLGYDIYVDDAGALVERFVSDAGCRGKSFVLVSAPWNSDVSYGPEDGVTIVNDLGSAIELLAGRGQLAVKP